MYGFVKRIVLAALKVPPEPEDPMGDVDTLVVFRASPNFFKYKLMFWIVKNALGALGYIFIAGILLAGAISASKNNGIGLTLALVAAGLLVVAYISQLFVSYVMLRLDYEMRWYKVTDRSLRIREGVMLVREMTMTFANIQNISVSQGPIQRLFGIADLRVETAGGGGVSTPQGDGQNALFSMHVGFFRGVDNIDEIKNLMLDRLKKYRDAGLGDTDDEAVRGEPSSRATLSVAILEALKAVKSEAATLRAAAEGKTSPPEKASASV